MARLQLLNETLNNKKWKLHEKEVRLMHKSIALINLELRLNNSRWPSAQLQPPLHRAGLLLTAYGRTRSLPYFLAEAAIAARSFRRHNTQLRIAIVTNNETVTSDFDIHIKPRADLLFGGDTINGGQNRGDNVPRQWLTRLLFYAHSPFEYTWALDSNVVTCTPNAAQAFLDEAVRTQLWGFDIAQANRVDNGGMRPHNWNIMYRRTTQLDQLLRDWLSLQLLRGVAADDQGTLHLAEQRLRLSGSLSVGQMPVQMAMALYPVGNGMRISRVVSGVAHVLHALTEADCSLFNAHHAPRQLLCTPPTAQDAATHADWKCQAHEVAAPVTTAAASATGSIAAAVGGNGGGGGSVLSTLLSLEACKRTFSGAACPYGQPWLVAQGKAAGTPAPERWPLPAAPPDAPNASEAEVASTAPSVPNVTAWTSAEAAAAEAISPHVFRPSYEAVDAAFLRQSLQEWAEKDGVATFL